MMDISQVEKWCEQSIVAESGGEKHVKLKYLMKSFENFASVTESIEEHDFSEILKDILYKKGIRIECKVRRVRGKRSTTISGIRLKEVTCHVEGKVSNVVVKAGEAFNSNVVNEVDGESIESTPLTEDNSSGELLGQHVDELDATNSQHCNSDLETDDSHAVLGANIHQKEAILTACDYQSDYVYKEDGKFVVLNESVYETEVSNPIGEINVSSGTAVETNVCEVAFEDSLNQACGAVSGIEDSYFESFDSESLNTSSINTDDLSCLNSEEMISHENKKLNKKTIFNYYSIGNKDSNDKEFEFTEKLFSFRKPSKESSNYDNLTFSRFYQNFKTITPSNLKSCNHKTFEDYLDSKYPTTEVKDQKLKSILLSAKSTSDFLKTRINAFLCGSFCPIFIGDVASESLEYLQASIPVPQFTAQTYTPNLTFKCEICCMYRDHLIRCGKCCYMGPGIFEGCQQLYEHSITNHHKSAIDFLKKDHPTVIKKLVRPPKHASEHISDFYKDLTSEKGKQVSCMFFWDPTFVNEFQNDQHIRRKSTKTLFSEKKLWKNCSTELKHKNCCKYEIWKENHPQQYKEICNESKYYSAQSVFVPSNKQKVLIQGKTITISGGIKSLDPPCLGIASTIGSHPFTCKNCFGQRRALNNLKSYRDKTASYSKTESRVGKKGMREDYATKTEKEQHYQETIQKNEALTKSNVAYRKQILSKSNWQKTLLESCQKDEVRKLVLDLVLLIESKDNTLAIKKDIIKICWEIEKWSEPQI
ncbi:uncharacterized protein [Clytia hemisphaerica]|uniref:Uncharacterized protein n=1 Tax=Clytia hemisphaerica TaxID=252671 RepID=A0A7M5UEE6_9CNID